MKPKNKYSFMSFIWKLWYAYKELRDIECFVHENRDEIMDNLNMDLCSLTVSKNLSKRYGLYENHNMLLWAILEATLKKRIIVINDFDDLKKNNSETVSIRSSVV